MAENQTSYREKMLQDISQVIENTGKVDTTYTNYQKALDILEVLEGLLAYTIFTTCTTVENIRDASEESYVNIKKSALMMFESENTDADTDKKIS